MNKKQCFPVKGRTLRCDYVHDISQPRYYKCSMHLNVIISMVWLRSMDNVKERDMYIGRDNFNNMLLNRMAKDIIS